MRRLSFLCLILVLLSPAAFSGEINTFLEGKTHESECFFDGYVYWLKEDESERIEDAPRDLFRMRPGDDKAELLIEGSDENWMWSVVNMGNTIAVNLTKSFGAEDDVWTLLDREGKKLGALPLGADAQFFSGKTLYCVGNNRILGISIDTLKSKTLYKLDKKQRALDEFWLIQRAGRKLYFRLSDGYSSENGVNDIWSLDLSSGKARKVVSGCRGSFFAAGDFCYYSDYERAATYRKPLSGGKAVLISNNAYTFAQGRNNYVFAYDYNNYAENGYKGVVLDLIAMQKSDLEDAIIGDYDVFSESVLGEKLLVYDNKANRYYESDNPINDLL